MLRRDLKLIVFIAFIVLLLSSPFSLFSQHRVKGQVTNSEGQPLIGVSVVQKSTNNGTTTSESGNYSIEVESQSILVFSIVGFTPKEVAVNNQSVVDVVLETTSSDLQEVVVVGYGTQKVTDVTGSLKSVNAENFNRGIVGAPTELIKGRVAGLNVTSVSGMPGETSTVTIRGPGGVRTDNTPLYVLDGFALDNSSTGGGDPLNFINSQDVESITVLKDASATAIYGARGANGVIIINTKRGREGRTDVHYSTDLGISKIARKMDLFSPDEWVDVEKEIGASFIDHGYRTDWQDVVFQKAFSQRHNLSFSGGTDQFSYYASLGLQDQEGVMKKSFFKRYTAHFSATQKFLGERGKFELNLNSTSTEQQNPNSDAVIRIMSMMNPTYPPSDTVVSQLKNEDYSNPLAAMNILKERTRIDRTVGNIIGSLNLIEGLQYKINFGVDHSRGMFDNQERASARESIDGRLETDYFINTNTLIENTLNYNKDWGKNHFSGLLGHSYQKIFIQTRKNSINKLQETSVEAQYDPGIGQSLNLGSNRPEGTATENELQSFFGRINYNYESKYFVTATLRADGSSKFGRNNKYGYFPSFSLGWTISNESFFGNSIFSNLKLRAGWGQTGNQEIPSKITHALFVTSVSGTTSYPLATDGSAPGGITNARLANPDLKWEVSKQTNVGLDFGLFDQKLVGSIDWFDKTSNDILLEVIDFDPIQPSNKVWRNVRDMKIRNKGLEIDLNYLNNSIGELGLEVGSNLALLTNKMTGSPYTVISTGEVNGTGLTGSIINGYINNEPIGTFFLKQFLGIGPDGNSEFLDVNEDGQIGDPDRLPSGTALPKIIYNFNFRLLYKNFSLSTNFHGVGGNKIYDNTANVLFNKANLGRGQMTDRSANKYPNESINAINEVSTRYLYSGDFLRLQDVTLGYNFNIADNASLSKVFTSFRIHLSAQNLFVITSYKGFDPEINADRSNEGISTYGIDWLSYPKARTFSLGLDIGF